MELFNTSNFSSKNEAARDFEIENVSSKKIVKRSHPSTDPAWDDGSAFSSLDFKAGDAGDGEPFKIGQRCEIVTNEKYLGEKGHICGQHEDGSPEFWVKLDNYDLQIRVSYEEIKFLEESIALLKGRSAFKIGDRFQSEWSSSVCTLIKIRANGKKPYTIQWENGRRIHCDESWLNEMKFFSQGETLKAIEEKEVTECNSNTPAFLQESPALNSQLRQPEQLTLSKQNYSLKTTPTLKQSSNTDFLVSPSIATLKTTAPNQENLTSIQSVSPAPEPQLQATELDSTTQNQDFGLKPWGALQTDNQTLQSSKIPQDLSTEDYEQCLEDSEWQTIAGTIRKSYQLRNSEVHTKEKDFSLLPTPTTYAKGSTGCRPAGQTRLEQRLRTFIMSGDKLNSAVPGWMMGFPVGWAEKVLMDGGEAISIQLPFTQEYATTSTSAENVTTSTPDQFAPSKQRSQLSGSVTSPRTPVQSDIKLLSTQEIIETLSISEDELDEFWNNEPALFKGFKIQWLGATIQKWRVEPNTLLKDRLPQSESIPEKFLEDKKQSPSIEPLSLSSVQSNTTPKNFLEESTADTKQLPSRKRRQCKGCLYKYLENKKL